MPLIYKPYQATLANKEGQKLYYPRLVKFGTTGVEFVHIKDVAGSFVADDAIDKDPDEDNKPGGGSGEAPDPAA